MKLKIECCDECPCLHNDEHIICLLAENGIEQDLEYIYPRLVPDWCPWRKDNILEVEIL